MDSHPLDALTPPEAAIPTTRERVQEKQNGNKGKQNRFLLFPFISFYFRESSLFKGLRPKEIKKFRLAQRASEVVR